MTRDSLTRNRERRERRRASHLADKPFRLLRNPYPPVEVLSAEQLERIHQTSLRILEEMGLEFLDDEALDIWERAGVQVDRATGRVHLDRGLIMEAVAQAPGQFSLRARNPAHDLPMGGNTINLAPGAGCPYVSDFERGRRPGTLAAFQELVRLVQQCPPLHVVGGVMVEPQDVPVPLRHLDQLYSQFTLSDKVVIASARGREVALDCVNMAALVFGGLEEVQRQPVLIGIINANSPLRYDTQMLGGLITYARYGQPVTVTPFILAGAMSPITMAAAIAQQNAEALAGVALTQLVNPGVPVIYGGFTTNIDMQTGSPAFGSPEGALAMFAGAQLARFYGLPYRGSGSLNNSKIPDAQASYETQMTLWPAILAHANLIHHSAGWLEAGLVFSYEKFMLDLEGLLMMYRLLDGIEVNDETLALDSMAEVGPGGHHFGTAHTLARFRSEFHLPLISDRQNYEAWVEQGSLDAAQRAHGLWKELLASYETPPLDPAIEEALWDYVGRRKEALSE
ncbi:MAG TPA: trimethylamine methyltransferase family protein [Anaerolineae bacterium]|nr:trimethylamine methyltransferase family protein [Anaerolineae bacterium]